MSQRNRAGRLVPVRAVPAVLALLAGLQGPCVPEALAADPLRLAVSGVEPVEGGVRFGLALEGGLPEDKLAALDGGELVGVTWELEVLRDRKLWFNTTVVKAEIQSTALFDPVTRRYALERRRGKTLLVSREAGARDEAVAWLERLEGFLLEARGERLVKPRVRWRARALLGRKLVLLFVPTTVTTEWARGELGASELGP